MNRVKDKVAVVTGGAAGIGKATCLLLAKEGALVAITDTNFDEGKAITQSIKNSGGSAEYWHLDVSKESEVEQVFTEVCQQWKKIDVLVNNAGISGVNKPTHEITEVEWNTCMAIKVNGVFFCTKHAIPSMIDAGGGSIINLSSIYGLVGAPGSPPYNASKGAVRLMSKTDARRSTQNTIFASILSILALSGHLWLRTILNNRGTLKLDALNLIAFIQLGISVSQMILPTAFSTLLRRSLSLSQARN